MPVQPVLIVGAGPTGLTLANLLGQAGVATVLVEKNAGTVAEPRAVSIDDEALRTIQGIGLGETVLPDVVLGYGLHYLAPSGRCFARVMPTVEESGYPRRSAFHQPLLEAALRAGLTRFPHVELRFGHRLEGLESRGDDVTASVREDGGPPYALRTQWVVGCDGGSSTVRGLLGIDMVGDSFRQRWLVVDTVDKTDEFPHTRVYCNPVRPAINLPGPHGTRRWEFMLKAEEDDDAMVQPEQVAALLRAHRGPKPVEIVRRLVYTSHARLAERWREGRIFLAGDAAHLTPPFAGQGMNTGLRDATNLGWKLAAVVQGRLGPGLLDSYEQERRPHTRRMIELAIRAGQLMAPPTRLRAWRNAWLLRALALVPPARDHVAERRYWPTPRFGRGFFVPDDRARHPLAGRLFPQPRVIGPDGRTVLLDELLGPGFALLWHRPDPRVPWPRPTHDLWQRLAPRFVAVRPPGPNETVPAPWLAVNDATQALARTCSRHQNALVLLRPDRYVAGACLPEEVDAFAVRLEALTEPILLRSRRTRA